MEKLSYTKVNGYKIPDLEMPDDGLPEEIHSVFGVSGGLNI